MHKVMTRAQQRTSTRPPSRGDSRRPSGTPPRTPGGPRRRTGPAGDGPQDSPVPARRTTTGPTDNRPGTAPRALRSRRTLRTTPPDATEGSTTDRGSTAQGGTPTTTTDREIQETPTRHGVPETATAPGTPSTAAPGAGRPAPLPIPQPRPTDLFADRLLAVLSGRRPVHWMLRHTAGRAYDELTLLAERAPLRTRGPLPVVRDIGYYVPRPGAIEAFARISAGGRLRALAFRLEQGQDLRWRCTAVETGGPHTTAG